MVRRGFRVLVPRQRAAAENRLRAALSTPTSDPGAAALAVLCAVSGIAASVVPAPRGRPERRDLAAHLNSLRLVVGPDLGEVLTATRDAYAGRPRDPDSFVPDDDGYGDGGGAGDGGGGGGGDGGGD